MLKILVIEDLDNGRLVDALIGLGFAPVARARMHQALSKLEHNSFSIVVLDRDYKEIDPLEVVLNVREIDSEIPVVVVGNSNDDPYNDLLRKQSKVYTLKDVSKETDADLKSLVKQ